MVYLLMFHDDSEAAAFKELTARLTRVERIWGRVSIVLALVVALGAAGLAYAIIPFEDRTYMRRSAVATGAAFFLGLVGVFVLSRVLLKPVRQRLTDRWVQELAERYNLEPQALREAVPPVH